MDTESYFPRQDSGYSTCVPSSIADDEHEDDRLLEFVDENDDLQQRELIVEYEDYKLRIVEIDDNGFEASQFGFSSDLTIDGIARIVTENNLGVDDFLERSPVSSPRRKPQQLSSDDDLEAETVHYPSYESASAEPSDEDGVSDPSFESPRICIPETSSDDNSATAQLVKHQAVEPNRYPSRQSDNREVVPRCRSGKRPARHSTLFQRNLKRSGTSTPFLGCEKPDLAATRKIKPPIFIPRLDVPPPFYVPHPPAKSIPTLSPLYGFQNCQQYQPRIPYRQSRKVSGPYLPQTYGNSSQPFPAPSIGKMDRSASAKLLMSFPDHHIAIFREVWQKVTLPHRWDLLYCDAIEESRGAANTHIDSAKVRFHCSVCRNGWTTMRGRILFWFQPQHNSGIIYYYPYHQKCAKCVSSPRDGNKNIRFEEPAWYPEEAERVISNLVFSIHHRFYKGPNPHKSSELQYAGRTGKPRSHHVTTTCEACLSGVCGRK